MITHPTASELLDGVIRFIEQNAAPQLKDRDAFMARVAVNALSAVKREIEGAAASESAARDRLAALLGREGDYAELNAALCEAIRTGEMALNAPGLIAHLKLEIIDQVRTNFPNYSGLKALGG